MATPNYQYEKRQKDLAKKKKQEEKRLRKASKTPETPAGTEDGNASAAPDPEKRG